MRERSMVAMPAALSIRRIICPSIADSLESLEETTTAAGSAGAAVSASTATIPAHLVARVTSCTSRRLWLRRCPHVVG